MRLENGRCLCKAQVLDVLHELLEALVAPGHACPGIDVVHLSYLVGEITCSNTDCNALLKPLAPPRHRDGYDLVQTSGLFSFMGAAEMQPELQKLMGR